MIHLAEGGTYSKRNLLRALGFDRDYREFILYSERIDALLDDLVRERALDMTRPIVLGDVDRYHVIDADKCRALAAAARLRAAR